MNGKGNLKLPGDSTAFQTKLLGPSLQGWMDSPKQRKSGGVEGIKGTWHDVYARTLYQLTLLCLCPYTWGIYGSFSFLHSFMTRWSQESRDFYVRSSWQEAPLPSLTSKSPGQPLLGCRRHQSVSSKVHTGQISNFWATVM